MTLSRETMMELMAYVDGEVDAETEVRIRELISSNEDARAFVESMTITSDWVRVAESSRAQMVNVDGIADSVMAQIGNTERHAFVRTRSIRPAVVGAGMSLLAMAAGVALYIKTASHDLAGSRSSIALGRGTEAASSALVAGDSASNDGVRLEQVDSPDHSVSIFYVASNSAHNANASSVVVWITDDEKNVLEGQ